MLVHQEVLGQPHLTRYPGHPTDNTSRVRFLYNLQVCKSRSWAYFFSYIFANFLRLIITNLLSNILGNFLRHSGAYRPWHILALNLGDFLTNFHVLEVPLNECGLGV